MKPSPSKTRKPSEWQRSTEMFSRFSVIDHVNGKDQVIAIHGHFNLKECCQLMNKLEEAIVYLEQKQQGPK